MCLPYGTSKTQVSGIPDPSLLGTSKYRYLIQKKDTAPLPFCIYLLLQIVEESKLAQCAIFSEQTLNGLEFELILKFINALKIPTYIPNLLRYSQPRMPSGSVSVSLVRFVKQTYGRSKNVLKAKGKKKNPQNLIKNSK